jgi:hypothetical protein
LAQEQGDQSWYPEDNDPTHQINSPAMLPTSMLLLNSSCDNMGNMGGSGTGSLPVPRLAIISTHPPQLLAHSFFHPHTSDPSCRHGALSVRIPTHHILTHTTPHPILLPSPPNTSPHRIYRRLRPLSLLLLLLLRLLLSVLFSVLFRSSHSHFGAGSGLESTPVVR